jgi:hypothetical protein
MFLIDVQKTFRVESEESELGAIMKEENWQIKVKLASIIEVANNLNVKYSLNEKILPNLELTI